MDENRYPATRPYSSPPFGRRRRGIPERITRYAIPLHVVRVTSDVMRVAAEEERESYVWWAGYFDSEGVGHVVTALHPDVPTSFGRVHLGLRDLTRLHAVLRKLDLVLVAELHTHPPGAGGQNEVDAAHPAAPYPGFISMVVPNFGLPHLWDLRNVHTYEYLSDLKWRQLDAQEIQERFAIVETLVVVGSTEP